MLLLILVVMLASLSAPSRHAEAFWQLPIPAQGPAPTDSIEPVADLSAAACGICHIPQFAQWQQTLHARAVSPGLLGQLDALAGPTVAECLTCHAPREESLTQWWAQGLAAQAHLAPVDCTACHVRGHVRHGPRAVAFTPHGPVAAKPLYREAAFCAACHQFDDDAPRFNGKPLQDTAAEWQRSRYAEAGVTCQGCHMRDGNHRIVGIHDAGFTREGLGIEAQRTATGLRVRVGNRGAGHALPTYVTPRILVTLAGADAGQDYRFENAGFENAVAGDAAAAIGATANAGPDAGPDADRSGALPVPRLTHVIARHMRWSEGAGWEELDDARLLPDQWVRLVLPLPAAMAATITVDVDPGYDYHARVYPALLARWADTLGDAERRLLEQARDEAAAAAYRLYRIACPPWQGQPVACTEALPQSPTALRVER